jgi:hypothetical protein
MSLDLPIPFSCKILYNKTKSNDNIRLRGLGAVPWYQRNMPPFFAVNETRKMGELFSSPIEVLLLI